MSKTKVRIDGKILEFDVGNCCEDHSNIPVSSRPDLKPTSSPDFKFCDKCGRQWKKCITYYGAALEVVDDWVPMPFDWEK